MLTKTYQYKFYLDANHFVVFDNKKGEIHPHTWEICVVIELFDDNFIPFHEIETTISDMLLAYQNKLINEIEPFNKLNPTLENIGDYFTKVISNKTSKLGWKLRHFIISETPSRSYITIY